MQFWLEMDLRARIIPASFLFQISTDIRSVLSRCKWSAKAARLTARVLCEDVCELHPCAASFLNFAFELRIASVMMLMRCLEFGARFLLLFWIWRQTCSAPTTWWLRTESAPPSHRLVLRWAKPVFESCIRTAPGDDGPCGEESVPRRSWRGARHVTPAPPPTDLTGVSQHVSPGWHHMLTWLGWFVKRNYRHEQDAVVRAAQFGDAVQEHGWHLLVSVLDESEDLEGKTSRLTLAVLEDRRLWVFIAPAENTQVGSWWCLSTRKGGWKQ